jgi:hypothetical protein
MSRDGEQKIAGVERKVDFTDEKIIPHLLRLF